ncbi:MAG: hypothetical protein ACI9O2_001057 [Flammeovirgaceae bacterium]|jgi:hypothetical protein
MSTPLNGKPITVGVFVPMTEAYIARAFLESRGIHCFIKEEIGKSYNFARLHFYEITELQVGQNDALKARTLLMENGYVTEKVDGPSKLMLGLDKFTADIPLIETWAFEKRVTAVAIVLLFLLAGLAALAMQNTLLR